MQLASHVRPCFGLGGTLVAKNCALVNGGGDEIVSLTVDRKPHGFLAPTWAIMGVANQYRITQAGLRPRNSPNIGATLKLDHC